MLKRLQLIGFKSFADRVDFDFAPGLTAIVGPNGSGKSNVVDGVKWVLGEQSAKSLRGSEMSDVIFNGSASRRSLGMAEVTLTFDNTRRSLATDASEVQITRRVYRSGEGEYLINNSPCRLKDIKDLFLGSGAGTDAYSIIEQGRVDVLLQASTKERRTIFEEAAGISRFKAKKIESLRKLERVDGNLQRIKDILDEVEKQLRSVRLQAAKAQRYQEYHGRLKELRVGLGLQEYAGLADRLATEASGLDELRAGLQQEMAQTQDWESQLQQLEQALQSLESAVRAQQELLTDAQQRIATATATQNHEAELTAKLEADLTRTRTDLASVTVRAVALTELFRETKQELTEAESTARSNEQTVQVLEEDVAAEAIRLEQLQSQLTVDRDTHFERMRLLGQFRNDVVTCKAEMDNLLRARTRVRQRSDQVADTLASLERQLEELVAAEELLQERLSAARHQLTDHLQERERLHQLRETTAQLAASLREQRSGVASRIEVLERLEQSHEGMTTGVREVLTLLEQPRPGPWRTVLGLVADFLTVRREYAPLIDLALGERASYFLVRDAHLLRTALDSRDPFSGRVSFLLLPNADGNASPRPNRLLDASPVVQVRMPLSAEGRPEHPGVVALAEQLVHCDHPELGDLPRRLLARTLIVRDLVSARMIAAHTTGFRFVTLRGELLEADGTLTVGQHHAETGILSRKSELRELRGQVIELDERLANLETDLGDLARRMAWIEAEAEHARQHIQLLAEQSADLRSRVMQHRERSSGLHEEVQLQRTELITIEQEITSLEETLTSAQQQAAQTEREVEALQKRVSEAERDIIEGQWRQQRQQQERTVARVAFAQVQERCTALRRRVEQVHTDLTQREAERAEGNLRLAQIEQQLHDSLSRRLLASSTLATGYLHKESAERLLGEWSATREQHRAQRQLLVEQTQHRRQSWHARQEQLHSRELTVNDLRYRLDSLSTRLTEDYAVQLRLTRTEDQTLCEAVDEQEQVLAIVPINEAELARAEEEIEELKKKLNRLGSVNLDALEELQQMELRFATLQTQYDDLAAAKHSLEDIIGRINVDSRRLFTETLATVRGHFQELFRKLFGGGQADIVLENESDVLESGIEVIARPPGKELRSISLLSGGEKTMTAVALLLAIFRSKPSPFCILDEVDAALDEANVGRLASVLREFLDRSQFILITHHKRTMAAADVLYGVTMQESGISKRVAVRFEDWPDEEQSPTPQAA